jgi:hypothetical protein
MFKQIWHLIQIIENQCKTDYFDYCDDNDKNIFKDIKFPKGVNICPRINLIEIDKVKSLKYFSLVYFLRKYTYCKNFTIDKDLYDNINNTTYNIY